MKWQQFEAGAPDLAAFARQELGRNRVMLIGTVRKDGSPRISLVEPWILDGDLYLGMMWQSVKALDLLRDPRFVLHNAICSSTGQETEISLRGRAIEVRDAELRAKYVLAVAERITWKEPHFHLFTLDIKSAAVVKYEAGEQSVMMWPQGKQFRRPYE
jgi:hypothetical protein